jgi:hypothetical protein
MKVAAALLLASASSVAAAPKGICEVTVDGALTASGRGAADRSDAATDYWFEPQELARAVRLLVRSQGGDEGAVAAAMKHDPKIVALDLNCPAGDLKLHFQPAPDSTYDDVPFAPHRYVVVKKPEAGQFLVDLTLQGTIYRLTGEGALDVTRFDAKGLAGTFELKAQKWKGTEVVTVKGKFDYSCLLPTKFCRGY